ncbi:MAG: hypothetical protein AAGL69_12490 [Pseudomonadota bacterium]
MSISWAPVKKNIGREVSYVLEKTVIPFRRKGQSLEWYRKVSGVLHLIFLERTKGQRVRLRAFASTDGPVTIGGNVTATTIEGGGNAGRDKTWSVQSEDDLTDSLDEIVDVLSEFVLPWLRTVCRRDQILEAREDFPVSRSYSIEPSDFDLTNEVSTGSVAAVERIRLQEFLASVETTLLPCLQRLGFQFQPSSQAFVRRRDDVFDIIEIRPFNYGTKFCCYAYNWISDLSATGEDEFSAESRVMLVGGVLQETKNGRTRLAAFDSVDRDTAITSLEHLSERLSVEINSELLTIRDRSEFLSAARKSHPQIVSAYGL